MTYHFDRTIELRNLIMDERYYTLDISTPITANVVWIDLDFLHIYQNIDNNNTWRENLPQFISEHISDIQIEAFSYLHKCQQHVLLKDTYIVLITAENYIIYMENEMDSEGNAVGIFYNAKNSMFVADIIASLAQSIQALYKGPIDWHIAHYANYGHGITSHKKQLFVLYPPKLDYLASHNLDNEYVTIEHIANLIKRVDKPLHILYFGTKYKAQELSKVIDSELIENMASFSIVSYTQDVFDYYMRYFKECFNNYYKNRLGDFEYIQNKNDTRLLMRLR